jgi:hypothetical protein
MSNLARLLILCIALSCLGAYTVASAAPSANEALNIVGEYNCVTRDSSGLTSTFHSSNTASAPWLRAQTSAPAAKGSPAYSGLVFVAFDAKAKRGSIIGVDSSGTYWTRHSTSPHFDDSQWIDVDPADGTRATIKVRNSGGEYTFTSQAPKPGGGVSRASTVCTRT